MLCKSQGTDREIQLAWHVWYSITVSVCVSPFARMTPFPKPVGFEPGRSNSFTTYLNPLRISLYPTCNEGEPKTSFLLHCILDHFTIPSLKRTEVFPTRNALGIPLHTKGRLSHSNCLRVCCKKEEYTIRLEKAWQDLSIQKVNKESVKEETKEHRSSCKFPAPKAEQFMM